MKALVELNITKQQFFLYFYQKKPPKYFIDFFSWILNFLKIII